MPEKMSRLLENLKADKNMPDRDYPTDEDRMIEVYRTHRDFIGWVIDRLRDEGIEARRTTSNDPNGDILIVNESDVPRVKEIVRNFDIDS